MRVPGTRRSRLIVLLSLAALTVAVGSWLFARARALYRNLGPLVVAELQRQLGREVKIGRLDAHHLGRVVLDDVAVAAEQRLSGGALFRAKRVVLTYSWLDVLWFRTDVVGSVRSVVIQQPFLLLVRDPTGQLNVQKLFKPRPGARPTTFRAQIIVSRGQLLFRDYKAALPRLPAANTVSGLDGVVDFRTFPRITARASGSGGHGRARLIQATTLVRNDDGGWLLRAYATDADAAYWSRYLLRTPWAQVRSGRGDVELVVSRDRAKAPLDYVVDLAAAGLGARVARLGAPLRGGRGVAQITPFGVKLDVSANLAGMPVQVSGNILDWKHPQVALSARGGGITMAAVRRVLPQIPGVPGLEVVTPGQVQAWLLGPAARLYASGTLTVPAAAWRGERVRDARVAWRYHAGMLQFDQVSAEDAAGARLAATGWAQVRPTPARIYVTGKLQNVNLAALPGTSPRLKLRGKGDISFAVSGVPKDLHGAATVQVAGLILNTTRLNAASARLDYQDGVLYVRSLQAANSNGRLVAAGTVGQHGDLNLQVRAKGIDLAALVTPITKTPASGTAYFSGAVLGTVRAPRLEGQLQLYAGRAGPVSTDYAEGRIVLLPDRLETEGLVLRLYPGQVTVRGTVGGWREGRTQVDLRASAQDVSVARLLAMANVRARVAGTFSGDLTLRGSPTTPVATGALRVDDLLVEGTHLGTATARLETGKGRLWVRQAAIDGDALAATAEGSIGLVASPKQPQVGVVTKESPLDLAFAVQRLDLARASTRAGARVLLQGIAQVTDGVVRGRLGAPVVTARAQVAPIVINGARFAGLSGQGTYTREGVALRDAALTDSGGVVRITQANLRPEPGKPMNGLSLDAAVQSFPVQRLIEVARNSASVRGAATAPTGPAAGFQDVRGPVSGTITARPESSEAGAPTLWTAALQAPELTVPGYRIAPPAPPAGSAGGPTPPPGGPAPTPAALAGGQPLSVGLVARASYSTAGRVTLERLTVTRDEGVLLAQGSLVQSGGRDAQGNVQPDGRLTLRVDATDIPMGLFGPLAPALHPLRGTGELHLDAAGPLRTPSVEGSVDVDRLALAGIPFSHFAIPHLRLAPPPPGGSLGKIQIENARLEQADKDHPSGEHYLLVDGSLPFSWKEMRVPAREPLAMTVRLPEQSLDVLNTLSKLNPLGVNPRVAPALTALGGLSAVSGTLSADLQVTGTRAQPDASGSFRIQNGAIQPQLGQTRFEQIAVQLNFTGNRIEVQKFQGRSSDGGTFEGSGDISGVAFGVGDQAPAARLNLALSLNDLHYTERNLTGYLKERFRGTVRTVDRSRPDQRAPLRLVGDWSAPTLQGAVQLQNTHLALPGSFPQAPERRPLAVMNPTFQLDVLLGKDVWLDSPRLRAQLAGRLPIRGTLAAPSVRGTLVVQRGDMIFPMARFRVEGDVEVAYAPAEGTAGAAPADTGAALRVDLTATSRLRGTDPNTGQPQRYDVTLVIRGPLSAEAYEGATTQLGTPTRPSAQRLTIEARSDPPLSQQQVMALVGQQSAVQSILAGGTSAQTALRGEIEDILTASVAPTLFVPLETAIEDWLGLEEFSVDFALREPLQVRLTKQIYGPFYTTYTRSLTVGGLGGGTPNTISPSTSLNLYTLEFYYKLSERFRLGYRFEEPSHNRVFLLNGTFRF